eukprot:scaffold18180_cov128-Isochrysis_galbana.AAC.2
MGEQGSSVETGAASIQTRQCAGSDSLITHPRGLPRPVERTGFQINEELLSLTARRVVRREILRSTREGRQVCEGDHGATLVHSPRSGRHGSCRVMWERELRLIQVVIKRISQSRRRASWCGLSLFGDPALYLLYRQRTVGECLRTTRQAGSSGCG